MEKKQTLEEAAKQYAQGKSSADVFREAHIRDFMAGAKWMRDKIKGGDNE